MSHSPSPSFQRNSVLEHARYYASLGWHVLPLYGFDFDANACTCNLAEDCEHPGKHPVLPSWYENATTDPTLIDLYFDPNLAFTRNIGISPGKRSNLIVVDFDTANALTEVEELSEQYDPASIDTYSVHTGKGVHLYFTFPSSVSSIPNRSIPGIDLISDRRQCVAPPSQHFSGRLYATGHPLRPVLPLPEWLLQHFHSRSTQYARSSSFVAGNLKIDPLDRLRGVMQPVAEGNRNNELFALCRVIARFRERYQLSDAACWERVVQFCEVECTPPLTLKEAAFTLRRALARTDPLSDVNIDLDLVEVQYATYIESEIAQQALTDPIGARIPVRFQRDALGKPLRVWR